MCIQQAKRGSLSNSSQSRTRRRKRKRSSLRRSCRDKRNECVNPFQHTRGRQPRLTNQPPRPSEPIGRNQRSEILAALNPSRSGEISDRKSSPHSQRLRRSAARAQHFRQGEGRTLTHAGRVEAQRADPTLSSERDLSCGPVCRHRQTEYEAFRGPLRAAACPGLPLPLSLAHWPERAAGRRFLEGIWRGGTHTL